MAESLARSAGGTGVTYTVAIYFVGGVRVRSAKPWLSAQDTRMPQMGSCLVFIYGASLSFIIGSFQQ